MMTFVFRASEMCRWDARGNLKTIATKIWRLAAIFVIFLLFFCLKMIFTWKIHIETMLIAWLDRCFRIFVISDLVSVSNILFSARVCLPFFFIHSFNMLLFFSVHFHFHSVEIAWKSVRTKYRLLFVVERYALVLFLNRLMCMSFSICSTYSCLIILLYKYVLFKHS